MQAAQPGRSARNPSTAAHRPACAHDARHPDRYVDVSDLRWCEIQSRCCRETGQRVAEATTAAAADFALSPSRIRSFKFAGHEYAGGFRTTNVVIEPRKRYAQTQASFGPKVTHSAELLTMSAAQPLH